MAGRTRTAKALAQRIDMDYFKRLHPFRRWRLWLSIAAPLAALLWLGGMAAGGSRSPYSSGPLSMAHQVFGQRCERCHVTEARAFSAHVTDAACLTCHDAPAHKTNQTFTPACATCHLDHRGAIRLGSVDNQPCEQCHRNLRTTDGRQTVVGSVGAFGQAHPEFAARRPGVTDPAALRFNHQVHVKQDLRGPNGPTTLECSTCHQPAVAQGSRANVPDRRGGLMAPVSYARNCASCHPLYFDPLVDAPVPHDKPEVVHPFVVQALQQFIAAYPEQIGMPDPVRGRIAVNFPTPMPAVRSAAEWTGARTAMAEQLLWSKTCAECHILQGQTDTLPRVVPTNIPAAWMPHARFDHRAHQLTGCASCHAAQASRDTSDVLMPSIATCQQCHRSQVGAESRCFECHEYHDWTKAKPSKPGFTLRQVTD